MDLSDPAQLQTLTQTQLAYSPKFSDLPIYFLGDNPGLALPDGPGFSPDGKCSDNVGTQAYITPTYGGRHGLVSVCKDTYKLQPMLADILAPPAWAIDWSKGLSNGPQYFPGFGCKNLGSFDSLYLQSTGAILLHEMFHYKCLFSNVPNYENSILTKLIIVLPGPGGRVTEHIITDFKGPILKNGYGPYNAEQINQLQPVDKDKLHWKGIYNADNDVWYALSSYYSRDCNIDFQRAPDEDSANTEPSRDLNPPGAYGPWNCARLNELEPTVGGVKWKGIFNAENYAYYAMSSYASRHCNTFFEKCPSPDLAVPALRTIKWPFSFPPPP